MRYRLPIVLSTVLAAALIAAPAPAGAGSTRLKGPIDPSGSVWFNVETHKRADGKRIVRVADFHFRKLPLRCEGEDETITSFLALKPRVIDGEFAQEAVIRNSQGKVIARLNLAGEIRRRGKRGNGTIRVAGDKVPVDSGGSKRCRSGRLNWKASAAD